MKKTISLVLCLWAYIPLFSQSLYDITSITTIELEFAEDNWDEILDTYYENDLDERLVASCVINGEAYDSVGVKFKGNSTYNASNLKNPLNIKLDHILDQKFQGYTTFKLSNGSKDPSFVREVLSYEIGRYYMDMPLANYAKVIINGSYYGLFSSVESVNSDYQERRLFCDDDNTRIKCNPQSVMDGSSLKYEGSDSSDYFDYYELKSDYGWNDLKDFTYQLNYDFTTIEEHLDVDRALWMLAFNNVLVNLDSYTGPFRQNYYLIKDDNDRFMPIIWDLNQSFGSFSMLGGGGGPGGGTDLEDLTDMDLFLREGDSDYPLIAQLFTVERYRKMYVAHVKTMVEENFADGSYYTRAEDIQDVIAGEVADEPNGFYTVAQFNGNLYETEGGGGGGPGGAGIFGISEVMDPRVEYFESLPEWSYIAPTISDISNSPAIVSAYNDIVITATIEDATYAYLGYRDDYQDAFTKVEMFDDGMHGDGAAGDNVYGVSITMSAKDLQFYIYADNDEAGKFSPVRAEHEFHNLIVQSNVVINEMMPQNEVSVADQDGEYDDWIELFNTTGSSIDLSGYYLSDRPNAEPLMWQIPEGTTIDANGYLTIWLDEDTLQDGLHANFKLSVSGETVSFTDPDGFEISRVRMPEMSSSITYGRYPNGSGPFMRMFPTFGTENAYTALSIEEDETDEADLDLFPNPTNSQFTVRFDSVEQTSVEIYDLSGKRIYADVVLSNESIDVSNWDDGMYLVVFPELGITKKVVKR